MSRSDDLLNEINEIISEYGGNSERVTDAILSDGNTNLVSLITRRALENMEEARRDYFKRPVVTLPFSVTPQTAEKILLSYPHVREFSYKPGPQLPDGLFRAKLHMAIRQVVLRLAQPSHDDVNDAMFDEDPIDDYQNAIILDGVEPKDHNFMFRSAQAIYKYSSRDFIPRLGMQGLIDHFNATDDLEEIIYDLSCKFSAIGAEFTVLTPFDKSMLNVSCANLPDHGYSFHWVDLTRPDMTINYINPKPLPKGFFEDDEYKTMVIRVYPYGGQTYMEIPRHIFNMLHMSFVAGSMFVETKMINQGFAEISIIFFQSKYYENKGFDLTKPSFDIVPPQHVEVKERRSEILHVTPGLQYSLRFPTSTFVDERVMNRVIKVALQLKITRNLAAPLIQHLATYTSRYTFNGVIIKVEQVMHPELIAMVVEQVLSYTIPQRLRLEQFGEGVLSQSLTNTEDILLTIARFMVYSVVNCNSPESILRSIKQFLMGTVDHSAIRFDTSMDALTESPNISQISVTDEQESQLKMLHDTALSLFGPIVDAPFEFKREQLALPQDESIVTHLTFKLRQFQRMAKDPNRVTVEQIQFIYDTAFPTVSMTDYTDIILMRERVDHTIILDVPSFKSSIYAMLSDKSKYLVLPSKLRTEIAMDLPSTYRTIMASLMKRNFNRPRPEIAGKQEEFASVAVYTALKAYGVKDFAKLTTIMQLYPIAPNESTIELWRKHHTEDELKAAAAIIAGKGKMSEPENYGLMGKGVAKPTLDPTAGEMILVGQTVIFHPKDVIALTVGIFTIILDRLLSLFPDSIRFAFGADEHTSGQWADLYLNEFEEPTFIYEFDMPKFDKSQDFTCYSLVTTVLKLVGCSSEFVDFWRQASMRADVFNTSFGIAFTMFFGNRSGCAGTIAINCIVLLFAFLNTFDDCGVLALLIKGDDSVVVLRHPMTQSHVEVMNKRWGFTMKQRQVRGAVTFCSSIFVKGQSGNYRLVRDPVKILAKLGRALSPERELSYFMDYYTSIVDTALQYDDETVINNLQLAVMLIYGQQIDVITILNFIKQLASSPQWFLNQLYGIHTKLIPLVTDGELCRSIILHAKVDGFIKSKLLRDMNPTLKRPFLDIVKSYAIVTALDISDKPEIQAQVDSWTRYN